MDFNDVKHIYKLDFNGLAKILKKKHIVLKLEHLNDIPETWIPLIEESLGVNTSKKNLVKTTPTKKDISGPERIGRINLEETKRTIQNKPLTKTVKTENFEEEPLVENLKTEYQKLSGPSTAGPKIDLSQFNKPNKKAKSQRITKRNKSKSLSNQCTGKQLFYAHVNFVGPKKDHAFVKRIDDIKSIATLDLFTQDDNSYKLMEDCLSIKKGDIILCAEKNRKFKSATLCGNAFEGLLKNEYPQAFIDLDSFNSPVVFDNIRIMRSNAKYHFGVFSMEYHRSRLILNLTTDDFDESKLKEKLKDSAKSSLLKSDGTYQDDLLLSCFKMLVPDEEYKSEISSVFTQVTQAIEKSEDKDFVLSTIQRWQELDKSLVKLNNFGHLELLSDYFKLWLENEINIDFFGNNLIDSIVKHELILRTKEYESEDILRIRERLQPQHKTAITEQLKSYLTQELSFISIEIYEIMLELIEVSRLINKKEAIEKINNSLSSEHSYNLWKANKEDAFNKEIALKEFVHEDAGIQEKIIKHIDDEDLGGILNDIKPQANKGINKRITEALTKQIPNQLGALSFDIESDGDRINEIAWNIQSNWCFYKGNHVENGIKLFKKSIDSKTNIIVGHNIIEFDCPILEKKGLTFNSDRIWDTLKVEVLLSPELKNYALKTAHTAKEDGVLTLKLFSNQVLRILKNAIKFEDLSILLSKDIIKSLELLKAEIPLHSITVEHLNNAKKEFYRPQELENPLISKLKADLKKSEASYKLILGPEGSKFSVKEIVGINFFEKTNKAIEFEILKVDAISQNELLSEYTKIVLKQFLAHCDLQGQRPFWINLNPYIRGLISKELTDPYLIFENQSEILNEKEVFFTSLKDLLENIEDIKSKGVMDLFVLQPDLLSTTEKILLKEIDQEFLNLIEGGNHFWTKFSGGQSYVPLSSKQLLALKVQVPEHITNFWIEKYQIGKYRIWGSYNWEKIALNLNVQNTCYYKLNEFDFPKGRMNLVGAGFNAYSGSNVVRFNPESIHRSRYWVFQKQLIDQIVRIASPIILLINQYNEIEILEHYFRKLGYYVPEGNISLGRRLELFHQNRTGGRLLIAHTNQIERILELNYAGPLEIVLDSFNLGENYYAAQGSEYFEKLHGKIENTSNFKKSTNDDDLEMDDEITSLETKSNPHIKDNFFLLKLQLPYVNHLRNLMLASDPNHRLWVLDARVNDYPDLVGYWNAYAQNFRLWESEEQYEKDVEFADKHIPSVKPLGKLPFDNERVKQILSEIFIDGNPWYEYQVPYLEEIIKGEKDLLVTLPTGGGKSLLFQGPALLKGSFTNRLTVVVTPLKALMEDQVSNLWDKGFHGCVEYLNTDRGTDVQLIYRSMAGGELTLLYVTPERFRSQSFLNALKLRIQSDGGLEYFVFDEAHCVSQWGHEFRPDYFNCAKRINQLKGESLKNSPLLLFSATVSEKIYNDFNLIFS